MQNVTCNVEIVEVSNGVVKAKLPARVMALPFPPFGKGANIVLFPIVKVLPLL